MSSWGDKPLPDKGPLPPLDISPPVKNEIVDSGTEPLPSGTTPELPQPGQPSVNFAAQPPKLPEAKTKRKDTRPIGGAVVNSARDKNGLTKLQKAYSDKYLAEGPSAAAKVYSNSDPHRVLANPSVSSYMQRVLEDNGGTKQHFAKKIVEKSNSFNESVSLKATEIGLKIHGELRDQTNVTINQFGPEAISNALNDYFMRKSAIPGESTQE